MGSKRKRKLQTKAARQVDTRMQARRDAFNNNLWRYGPPIVVLLIITGVIYFGFFYELGDPKAKSWELDEAQTGVTYSSDDYYGTGDLIFVEFFHSDCPHCQSQAPVLADIYDNYMDAESVNYSSSFHMFSIGGYKLSSSDSKSDIAQFKFEYGLEWPHLYDPSGELMRDYNFQSYPSMALVKNNDIVYYHSGGLTYEQLSKEIETYL